MAIFVCSMVYGKSGGSEEIRFCDTLVSAPLVLQVTCASQARLNRRESNTRLRAKGSVFAFAAFLLAYQAHADSPALAENSGQIDEIVVTAQKRVSTVQTTPISISAVSGDDLLARGVSSLAALA